MVALIAVGVAVAVGLAAGRASRPWTWLIPGGVTAVIVVVALVPLAAAGFGGEGIDTVAAIGTWAAGLVVVALLVRWLAARGPGWSGVVVGFLGGLLVVNAVAIVHVWQQMPAASVPRDRAWLWYWAAVAPGDYDLGGRDGLGLYLVRDILEMRPAVLTAVTAFVLTATYRASRRPAARLEAVAA